MLRCDAWDLRRGREWNVLIVRDAIPKPEPYGSGSEPTSLRCFYRAAGALNPHPPLRLGGVPQTEQR